MTISGKSITGNAFAVDQDVAVRADKASSEQFWLGKIVVVRKASLKLRWYEVDDTGQYNLLAASEVDSVRNGAVLPVTIQWTRAMKLTKATLNKIIKAL